MYRNILAPMDGSQLAECVLPHLEAIVKGCGADTVTFIAVVQPAPVAGGWEYSVSEEQAKQSQSASKIAAENYLKTLANRIKYDGVKVKWEVIAMERYHEIIPRVGDAIVEYADKNNMDLIVIATHGGAGPSRAIWGSVAGQVLRTSDMPVLMIRPKECIVRH
jgi:nucleotide-binding universal stress UspA family protein